jgi:hypothetical protein
MRTTRLGALVIACSALLLALSDAHAEPPLATEEAQPKAKPAADKQPATAEPAVPATGQADSAPGSMPGSALDPNGAPGPSGDPAPMPPNTGEPKPPGPALGTDALRQRCEAAIRDDAEWRTELKENLARRLFEAPQSARDEELRDMVRREAHEAESKRLLRDKQHVVYAYGALWILTALFVLYMFVRQRSLDDEIARLRRELEQAVES